MFARRRCYDGYAGLRRLAGQDRRGIYYRRNDDKETFDGREYLLETALRGNVALVKATVADKFGNCFMRGSTKNFGALMARAADYVIVEAKKIVEVGELDPELVTLPGIFIDAIVQSEDTYGC